MPCYMQTVDAGSLEKLKNLMNDCACPIAYILSELNYTEIQILERTVKKIVCACPV